MILPGWNQQKQRGTGLLAALATRVQWKEDAVDLKQVQHGVLRWLLCAFLLVPGIAREFVRRVLDCALSILPRRGVCD